MQDNGNTTLSPAVSKAYDRIKTLKTITAKTGMATTQEQFKILVELANDDALALAELLYRDKTSAVR